MQSFLYQLLATFGFFTRLPFWRLAQVPKSYYEQVVPYWPIVGWLTGGLMGLVCIVAPFPAHIAVILALIVRCLVTGALHEDGYADFCDGFGGGYSRDRILAIMKDSHIGTYGVLGLILYFLLQVGTMSRVVETQQSAVSLLMVVIASDSICKLIASSIVYVLPYARTAEESKNKLVYKVPCCWAIIKGFVFALLPIVVLVFCAEIELVSHLFLASLFSVITAMLLFRYMRKQIQGYTGDCCGATFVITEAVFYLVLAGMV